MSKDEETLREGTSRDASPTSDSEKSKKRKSTVVDEIEVDLNAPEPPSKRAKRALKKGKKLPAKGANEDDEKDGEDAKEDKAKRSEHGVWIGNLPFTVTPAELKQWLVDNSGGVVLEESITRIKMPMNKDKARSRGREDNKPMNKGFAYVDFDGIGAQMAAIALSENKLGYRSLLIKNSTSFEGRPKKEKTETVAEATTEAELAKNTNRKVFVGNLGFATNEDDLWSHFEKCGEIEWVKVATFEDTGKCKGYGWVKFKTPEAASWAAKGFVKIKEEILTEDDFRGPQEAKDEGGADADADAKDGEEKRKYKMRKWWVNKLKGRTLKIEMAEDDQARYKKRFGKDKRPDAQGRDVNSSMASETVAA